MFRWFRSLFRRRPTPVREYLPPGVSYVPAERLPDQLKRRLDVPGCEVIGTYLDKDGNPYNTVVRSMAIPPDEPADK